MTTYALMPPKAQQPMHGTTCLHCWDTVPGSPWLWTPSGRSVYFQKIGDLVSGPPTSTKTTLELCRRLSVSACCCSLSVTTCQSHQVAQWSCLQNYMVQSRIWPQTGDLLSGRCTRLKLYWWDNKIVILVGVLSCCLNPPCNPDLPSQYCSNRLIQSFPYTPCIATKEAEVY